MSEHEKAQKVAMRTDELARLRGENERLKRSFSPRYDDRRDIAAVIEHLRFGDSDGDDHDAAATEIERLQSELTALRRPVERSVDIERIRSDADRSYGHRFSHPPFEMTDDIRTLLSALDTTARQLRERVEMLEAAQREICELKEERAEYLETNSQTNKMLLEIGPQLLSERKARAAAEKEIARLSSPPQERAEIVERHAARLDFLRTHDYPLSSDPPGSDIDTLLGDCAAWRNCVEVLKADRDHFKSRCELITASMLTTDAKESK